MPAGVHPDGSLAELDLATARLAVNAGGADAEAGRLGAIRCSRTQYPPFASGIARSRVRAAIQILDKLQGHPVVGVLLMDSW